MSTNADLSYKLINEINSYIIQAKYELDKYKSLLSLFDEAYYSKNVLSHIILSKVAFESAKANFLLLKKHLNNYSHQEYLDYLSQISDYYLLVESLYHQLDNKNLFNCSILLSSQNNVSLDRSQLIHQVYINLDAIAFHLDKISMNLDIHCQKRSIHFNSNTLNSFNESSNIDSIIYEQFKKIRLSDNRDIIFDDQERVIVECQNIDTRSDLEPQCFSWSKDGPDFVSADVYNGEFHFSTFGQGCFSTQSLNSAQKVLRDTFKSNISATIEIFSIKRECDYYDLLRSIEVVISSDVDYIDIKIPNYIQEKLSKMIDKCSQEGVPPHLVRALNKLKSSIKVNNRPIFFMGDSIDISGTARPSL